MQKATPARVQVVGKRKTGSKSKDDKVTVAAKARVKTKANKTRAAKANPTKDGREH